MSKVIYLVVVGSDIEVLAVGVRSVVRDEQVVVRVRVGPDGEQVVADRLDDPLVSVLLEVLVGSDVEVVAELSVVVVRDEQVVARVGDRSDQVLVVVRVDQLELVSRLLDNIIKLGISLRKIGGGIGNCSERTDHSRTEPRI